MKLKTIFCLFTSKFFSLIPILIFTNYVSTKDKNGHNLNRNYVLCDNSRKGKYKQKDAVDISRRGNMLIV